MVFVNVRWIRTTVDSYIVFLGLWDLCDSNKVYQNQMMTFFISKFSITYTSVYAPIDPIPLPPITFSIWLVSFFDFSWIWQFPATVMNLAPVNLHIMLSGDHHVEYWKMYSFRKNSRFTFLTTMGLTSKVFSFLLCLPLWYAPGFFLPFKFLLLFRHFSELCAIDFYIDFMHIYF